MRWPNTAPFMRQPPHCTARRRNLTAARKLERETGMVLSEKDGRGLRLTDARLLADSAVTILDQVEQAEAALAAHHRNGHRPGQTVASFGYRLPALLPAAACGLGAKHPQLTRRSSSEPIPYEAACRSWRGPRRTWRCVDDSPEVGLHLPEGMFLFGP